MDLHQSLLFMTLSPWHRHHEVHEGWWDGWLMLVYIDSSSLVTGGESRAGGRCLSPARNMASLAELEYDAVAACH